MKGPGILWMLQTAAGLSMAGPMFVVGFEFIRTDRILAGIGFFVLGAVTLYFPTYVINRIGGPRAWVRRRIDRRREGTESDAEEPGADVANGDGTNEGTMNEGATNENDSSKRVNPLKRLRRR